MSEDTIVRSEKSVNQPFTRIDNRLISDAQLTFAARGLMCFLLSKPNKWNVVKEHLVNSSPGGITSINNLLRELEEAGYVGKKVSE